MDDVWGDLTRAKIHYGSLCQSELKPQTNPQPRNHGKYFIINTNDSSEYFVQCFPASYRVDPKESGGVIQTLKTWG